MSTPPMDLDTPSAIHSQQQSDALKHTFVLVHGSWVGGWIWRDVQLSLQKQGHAVTAPTLSGLGERRHLQHRDISLSTHIEDIVAHIEMEGLQNVTLVGASYGGMVTTGVLARIPHRIKSMIYLDAFVPEDGKAFADYLPPQALTSWTSLKEQNKSIPPIPLQVLRLTDPATVEFAEPRLVDHPWRTLFEPVKALPRPSHISMSYVRCTGNTAPHFDQIQERLRRDPDVRTATLDTTHLCMLTAPKETVEVLLDLAGAS